MLIAAAVSEITGASVSEFGEDMSSHALAQRKFQLMAGAIRHPLHWQEVRIEQVRTREPEGNLSGAIPQAKGPTMVAQLEALVDRLDDLVGYTPDGEKRNALADAHNSLVEAIDHLKKAKSL